MALADQIGVIGASIKLGVARSVLFKWRAEAKAATPSAEPKHAPVVDVPVTRKPGTGYVCSCGESFLVRTSFNRHKAEIPDARRHEHQLEEPEDDG